MTSIYTQGPKDDLAQVISGMQASQQTDRVQEEAAKVADAQKDNLQAQQQDQDGNPLVAAFKKQDKLIKPHTSVVKKSKEAKEGQKKLLPPKEIENTAREFSRKNPQFPPSGLLDLTKKLKDGMSKKEILELVHKEYPDPFDASLALEFLASVALDDYQESIRGVQSDLNKEIIEKREEEVAKKVEAEALKATQDANAAALKVVQGGDLNKLLDHLMSNPLEATAIFKMLDDAYGENLKKTETFLLKGCGVEVNKLKKLKDNEDKAFMKNVMALLKKLQAIIGVDRYFEIRNPAPKEADKSKTSPGAGG